MLYREPKLLKAGVAALGDHNAAVSVLYREPKLLKDFATQRRALTVFVSVLYREPKLLKVKVGLVGFSKYQRFSALP